MLDNRGQQAYNKYIMIDEIIASMNKIMGINTEKPRKTYKRRLHLATHNRMKPTLSEYIIPIMPTEPSENAHESASNQDIFNVVYKVEQR